MPEPPPSPPPLVPPAIDSSESTGELVDEGRGRIFPCPECGADLVFSIGQQEMKCPYCGHVVQIEIPADATVAEQDYNAMLARLREFREKGLEDQPVLGTHEVRCSACGANVVFTGTLTSSECPYCGAPIQRERIHTAEHRIAVDGVLPFAIPEETAAKNLREWIASRWFAPNDFRERARYGKFNGVYLPFFTFDTLTFTRYTGQRGEHYWETVGSGKDRRQVMRTRWWPASGAFQRFFDDVVVLGAKGMNPTLMLALEPWPLGKCLPFNQQVLAGLSARTYDTPLEQCFAEAKQRIESLLEADVRGRIGGDEQRISSMDVRYSAITFKHLLLPVWLLAYRYHDKVYQVTINAATGEVQGERPYSWIKITLAVLAALLVIGVIVYFQQR